MYFPKQIDEAPIDLLTQLQKQHQETDEMIYYTIIETLH